MLSKADDFPIHQTPEPVAAVTDRHFYDRYFFNGYSPDGEEFFAAAFGVYPGLGIVDAHFSVVRAGIQHCLHASRHLGTERLDLTCGPIRIVVEEPLRKLRVIVTGESLSADLIFTGRSPPIEEPRFVWATGERTIMDYTRLTQNSFIEGWIEVDGDRRACAPGMAGTRDRSWGIRPVGPPPPGGHGVVQFFWQWTPVNLPARSLFFHLNAYADGTPWNSRAVIVEDGSDTQGEHRDGRMTTTLVAGTRWPAGGELEVGGETFRFEPVGRLQMRGIGYTSPTWGHGLDHGPLAVERERIELATVDPARLDNLHVQMLCRVTGTDGEVGLGVFEQLALGAYGPLSLS